MHQKNLISKSGAIDEGFIIFSLNMSIDEVVHAGKLGRKNLRK